ncbi:hypothetical protein VTI74DRAFT_1471 [Chaetomium olivicolor]
MVRGHGSRPSLLCRHRLGASGGRLGGEDESEMSGSAGRFCWLRCRGCLKPGNCQTSNCQAHYTDHPRKPIHPPMTAADEAQRGSRELENGCLTHTALVNVSYPG